MDRLVSICFGLLTVFSGLCIFSSSEDLLLGAFVTFIGCVQVILYGGYWIIESKER